jgi:hypothetical protein
MTRAVINLIEKAKSFFTTGKLLIAMADISKNIPFGTQLRLCGGKSICLAYAYWHRLDANDICQGTYLQNLVLEFSRLSKQGMVAGRVCWRL